MRLHRIVLGLIALALTSATHANAASRPALWGGLAPGVESVGFKTLFVRDPARVWRTTRNFKTAFTPDLEGRPLQINLWYPAVAGTGREMRYRDYVEQAAPAGFADLDERMLKRSRAGVSFLPPDAARRLLAEPVGARASADPKTARFSLVLLVGGLGAEINANAVMAEHLASHGYVVASLSLLGPNERQPEPSRSAESMEATVRDLEFATPRICAEAEADCGRLAVVGHSLGGVAATLFAMRNGNVSAVVALDGTFGFKGDGKVLTESIGYAPRAMRAALLDLRRAQGEQSADIDLSPILAMAQADLTLASLAHVHHSDFTSFAMIADRYRAPPEPVYAATGWTRATGRQGYEHSARIVLAFLDAKLRVGTAPTDLARLVAASPGSTFRHVAASPPVPSPAEAVEIAGQDGMSTLQALFVDACGSVTPDQCVDQDLFNSTGYGLLSQNSRSAVMLFEIVAWAHPASANAQDSLADGFLAAGRPEDARRATLRQLELVGSDPALSESDRRGLTEAAENRLSALNGLVGR